MEAPAFRLVKERGLAEPGDAEECRQWVLKRVRLQVKRFGTPVPSLLLTGRGYVLVLNLHEVSTKDPEASVAATVASLGQPPGIEHRFLVFQLAMTLTNGEEAWAAYVVEIPADDDPEANWWAAYLHYERDPESGLGTPQEWVVVPQIAASGLLPPFVEELINPKPGARPARVLPPAEQLLLKVAFGELPEGRSAPSGLKEVLLTTADMFAVELLRGRLKGTIVLRYDGRSWEGWALQDPLPVSLQDAVRALVNQREEAPDAVALIQVAIRPEQDPPVAGLQVVAEQGGMMSELWGPIEHLDDGEKQVPDIKMRAPRAVGERGLWIGVEPSESVDLTPTGWAEA